MMSAGPHTAATIRVLVVENDHDLRDAIQAGLTAGGLAVRTAGDIAAADRELGPDSAAGPDCVVFDRMLPDGDAVHYVHRRRQHGWAVPVLFLTARDTLADRVAGFAHGGDDYLVKPFALGELLARVRALARRAGSGRPSVLRHEDIEMDCARREVRRAGALLTLGDKEFAILEYLLVHADVAVGRAELIEHCWDAQTDPTSNVVDAIIGKLRRKLRPPNVIQTVRGHGYRLVPAAGTPR